MAGRALPANPQWRHSSGYTTDALGTEIASKDRLSATSFIRRKAVAVADLCSKSLGDWEVRNGQYRTMFRALIRAVRRLR